jgi:hypothetical protein
MQAIKDYENNKWKVIGQKVGKPAKVRSPVFFLFRSVVYHLVLALATIASCRGHGLATDRDILRLLASTSSTTRLGPQARPSQTLLGSES